MQNGIKMTIKMMLVVMKPKFWSNWGEAITKCYRGVKSQKVQYDPLLLSTEE